MPKDGLHVSQGQCDLVVVLRPSTITDGPRQQQLHVLACSITRVVDGNRTPPPLDVISQPPETVCAVGGIERAFPEETGMKLTGKLLEE